MSSINFHTKEISAKIVYYGPGLCGKTTSLQTIYHSLPAERRPDMVSLATEVDRTIFFDFLPVTAYRIKDFTVRLQLYTVPGQVFYNGTRKLVLNGVDGLVLVLDSQAPMRDANAESIENLKENLAELGLDSQRVPMVLQYNKRDLPNILSVTDMDQAYNPNGLQRFESIATTGHGVFAALKSVSRMVVNDLIRKGLGRQLREGEERAPPTQAFSVDGANADGFASVSEAVERAVQNESDHKAHRAESGLWPRGEHASLFARIDRALRTADWSALVLDVDAVLLHEAKGWLETVGKKYTGVDPVGTFLLIRGASGVRFTAFLRSVRRAREGHPVSQKEAMSALVLALESVW